LGVHKIDFQRPDRPQLELSEQMPVYTRILVAVKVQRAFVGPDLIFQLRKPAYLMKPATKKIKHGTD
jgi:hypothetical protein